MDEINKKWNYEDVNGKLMKTQSYSTKRFNLAAVENIYLSSIKMILLC